MKVGIVAPSPVPFTRGGAERAWAGLARAVEGLPGHDAEIVKLPVREDTLPGLVASYKAFTRLDVSHFDMVVTSKYPAWIVHHPNHVLWMFHPLRGLYDTYHVFGRPLEAHPEVDAVADLVRLTQTPPDRDRLEDLFAHFDAAVAAAGPDHPDLALPSPVARAVVHWLDAVALAPGAVRRHLALSRTVAHRPGYFPPGVHPEVVHAPSDLQAEATDVPGTYFFTASRLDGPKRLDLLIDAMAHVPDDVGLVIGGTGPLADDLAARAAGDHRISLPGFVADGELAGLYAGAIAVPFLPADEDYGLIAVEAMACGTPVVTCTDSGGPTELVIEGVTGHITAPTPEALGRALAALAADPVAARRMGRTARRRALELTWPATAAAVLGEGPPATVGGTEPTGPATAAPRRAPGPVTGATAPRRPRVVALTTFRVADRRHGGQLRSFHLYGALARHVDVEIVSLVDPSQQTGRREIAPGLWETAVARSAEHVATATRLTLAAGLPVTDIVAGTHVHESPGYLTAVRERAARASMVLLAEPYLLPAAERAAPDLPRLYDAFNVEADLKASVLPATPMGRHLLEAVRSVEDRAVRGSAAITTCSAEDADRLAVIHDRARGDFTVVPNGTDCGPVPATAATRHRRGRMWLDRWQAVHPTGRRAEHLAVFFASWHPPNLRAAEILMWLAPQLPEVQFVLGGSHGDAFIDRDPPSNLVFTGMVSDRAKHALLAAADVALNPMLDGSGTNLKVIEYFAAGVPVVSTRFGVRGLAVTDGDEVLVAEPHEMVEAVRSVIADPAAAARRAVAARALAEASYDWSALGDRLAEVVAEVVDGARSGVGSPLGSCSGARRR